MQVVVRLQICGIQSQERDLITTAPSSESKGDAIVRLFSAKGFNAFRELCVTLELESPHLLTALLLDNGGAGHRGQLTC